MNKEKDYSTFKVSRKLMEAINGTKRRNVQIELSKDAGHRVPPPPKVSVQRYIALELSRSNMRFNIKDWEKVVNGKY